MKNRKFQSDKENHKVAPTNCARAETTEAVACLEGIRKAHLIKNGPIHTESDFVEELNEIG
mgnify:CR=1 FL=1